MHRMGYAAALLLLAGCKGQDSAGQQPPTNPPAPATQVATVAAAPVAPVDTPREAAESVELTQLLAEYKDNEVRADGAFKTGDANAIIIDDKGGDSAGVLTCVGPIGDHSAAEVYDIYEKKTSEDRTATFIGSRKAACFGQFWRRDKGKRVPFPDEVKARTQVFFDAL